ncbi:fimbrial protein [Trabulsiella odontotermitis]|uniref:fimbrial protein n=1 Tax=Trabulsiella odontotermitis TaxID=379893 RepID=UPI0009BA9935|nr:fimbrial protein [Trabulsiella odontotermitis]
MTTTRWLPLSLCLLALAAKADESGNQMQLSFSGQVSIPTCKLVIPEKYLTLPSALVGDFSPLAVGETYGEKAFTVSVGDCTGGRDQVSQVLLMFAAKNGDTDANFAAFNNQIEDKGDPSAKGIAVVIDDDRDDSSVLSPEGKTRYIVYPTAEYPVGSEYHFTARYIKTANEVKSGFFYADVIITATYE